MTRSLSTTAAALGAGALILAGTAPVEAAPSRASTVSPTTLATIASPAVNRIAGADRYATSVAASRAAFPTGSHPAGVYLVSGTSPWESLSATPAAVKQDGGVLLTRADGIPSSVAAELKRLAPGSIVVVGSTSTISNTVLTQATAYAT